MKKIINALVFLFVLALAYTSQAGTQLTGLMGGDVTDPGNKIQASGTYTNEADWEARYADATWVSIQSYKKGPFESNDVRPTSSITWSAVGPRSGTIPSGRT